MTKRLFLFIFIGLSISGGFFVLAQDADVDEKIKHAMSAAPLSISKEATVLDWPFNEDGQLTVLREGNNGWSCLARYPKSMCLDEVFMEWLYALVAGEELTVTKPGYTYMLKGGATNSNADPFASEPADDIWESDAPYMMVIYPTGTDLSGFSTDPNDPLFVMFGDTSYEHIMVPLGDAEESSGM